MQQEPPAIIPPVTHTSTLSTTASTQHGPLHRDRDGLRRVFHGDSSGGSSRLGHEARRRSHNNAVDAEMLDQELRGLNLDDRAFVPGHRISEYENAMTPPTPKRALGFKVIKRSDTPSDGVQLLDFPNEILTQILSHLHADSHAAIALVSKRFYALITSAHAWRMAFLRYFPGQEALGHKPSIDIWADGSSEFVRSEARYFARLTPLASWRKEYLLRTRLLRSLARGKSTVGVAGASVRGGKKHSAVLTYNSKLPWAVTNIHAVFSNGKKPPSAIQGASDLGAATISDPTNGKIEKWGLVDPFRNLQVEEVFPGLVPYGLGDGPAATANVMDVSQPYGMLSGEGFPGGRAFFRPILEPRGRYLVADTGVVDTYPDIPKIPEMSQAICSVWLAKSSAVPLNTQSMVGMLTGSTLGVVTSYAVACDSAGPRYKTGEITARWVLSPGVPIISLKVDDNYSLRRKAAGRIWAVALNALGEVYYLTDVPVNSLAQNKGEDPTKNAWYAGRSVYWHLLESTRRVARPDDSDKNATKGAYSPRSPVNSMNLSKSQMAAEAREIEKFLHHTPAHFRRVCEGWDMLRKLEVDFASDDGEGAGEHIFVLDCGYAEGLSSRIRRYTRSLVAHGVPTASEVESPSEVQSFTSPGPSLFGPVQSELVNDSEAPQREQPPEPKVLSPVPSTDVIDSLHDWTISHMNLKGQGVFTITSCALDNSFNALLTLADDPLVEVEEEIPGRRSRLLAVGTNDGVVLVWNGRAESRETTVQPVRYIATDSPEVSCVALTGLYLVHGGNDGLVQAWDPLASSLEPIRTLSARSNGRVPRHMTTMNPALDENTYAAVGAIYLDPDPTVLRGVVSFGAFLRYWAYSSTSHTASRKRRLRHADIHGRLASRRQGGDVSDFIAAETAELEHEIELNSREQARLRNRFGVGLGDLTESEALRYAQLVSEEAFLLEEQRRMSDSAAEASLDTASTFSGSTVDTATPEPSVTGLTPPTTGTSEGTHAMGEDEFEQQIQQAIRLSLLESGNDNIESPRGDADHMLSTPENSAYVQSPQDHHTSGDYEFPVTFKTKTPKKKKKHSGAPSPQAGSAHASGSSGQMMTRDDDLELALKLSLQDQALFPPNEVDQDAHYEEFPMLETEGVGKGKGVRRW
ncbi:hypothetical protein BGZ63DRAFT_352549 [Mariannaea sp. PMI_226]|nr:hypothetical protein BGZ63DRAFT_352549 [Mariannaea sp. PMI_226]